MIQTPHRFRTKRQLWAYSGLALETRSSGEYRYVQGRLERSHKPVALRGLNQNHNHDLKGIFKGAAGKSQQRSRALLGVLCRLGRPRDETNHGAPHVGA